MRKKMYKSGKIWVAALAGSIAVTIGTNVAHADDINTQQTTNTQSVTDAINKTVWTGGTDGHYITDSDGRQHFVVNATGQSVVGLQTIDGHLQYFDPTTTAQVKGTLKTIGSDTYYFAANSGNAITGTQNVDGLLFGFDQQFKLVKNGFVTNYDGSTYYFDQTGKNVTGLQNIDGKTYYFAPSGVMKKGGDSAVLINGVEYIFDAIDGHATIANQQQFAIGLNSQNNEFSVHNQIAAIDRQDIDNTDGFITANAWYQPKDILQEGKTWVSSTTNDRRPLLMTWWPDAKTEAAYINFMLSNHIGQGDPVNVLKNSQEELNQAANQIQVAIEQKISSDQSTDWLKQLVSQFIITQPNWNIISEMPSTGFQGGTLAYQNSNITPDTNSDYRYLNRNPTNQNNVDSSRVNSKTNETPETSAVNSEGANPNGGYEFLLANDIDNSNPVVQAEQLNWLHYLMNFGTITANNSNANFDSIRIDAVDNVDADLLQIAADYMKSVYGTNQSDQSANKHLSIMEDWSYDDFNYVGEQGSNQLTMDFKSQVQLLFSLSKDPNNRAGMDRFLAWYNVNRKVDNTENQAIPNYSFVRSHDSQSQTIIAQIINDLYPGSNGLMPTDSQLKAAFEVFRADQESTVKKYALYNIPASYAMLLTNKDTVPRVYYGDLYQEDGQYMAEQTPYYNAITTLLKDRIKYVAGGQTTSVGVVDTLTKQPINHNDVLTTVRFGQGLLNETDQDSTNHTDGMGVIISNNPDLQLGQNEQVVLHMGAAHKNQLFRASLLSTKDGLQIYNSDDSAPTMMTNENGDLVFDSSWIYGVSDPQVSGYLAVWVPVGAAADQDARTSSDTSASTDGKTFHSNAALDSNVVYEGFSNFQALPTKIDEFANAKIAANADLFKSWGITSFEFAPQYRSSTDASFLDSIVKNGYAFSDRYDLGFDNADGTLNPTKYGTAEQLRSAIEALHQVGLQAMADWVPNQVYNLPGQEATTVTRTDEYGNPLTDSTFNNLVYITNTKSSGSDYQSKYGGAFLSDLKNRYPELFEKNQISTGVPIDGSQKITQWSAKYLNGTNILGRGAYFTLKDWSSNQYLNISQTGTAFLPKQLLNQESFSGFNKVAGGIVYYSLSGYQAKDSFIQDRDGNWYYFNTDGYMVTGEQEINGIKYFFLSNGIELQNHTWLDSNGNLRYSGQTGQSIVLQNTLTSTVDGYYITDSAGNQKFILKYNSLPVIGLYTIDGNIQYFSSPGGAQIKGAWQTVNNQKYYFAPGSGNALTGLQTIDGQLYEFTAEGVLLRNLSNGGGTTTPTVPSDNGGTTNNGGGTTTPTEPSDNGETTNNGGGTTTPTAPSDNGGTTNNGGGTTTPTAPSDNGGTTNNGGGTTTPTAPSDNGGTTNNGGGTTTPTAPSDNGGTTNNGGGTTPTAPSDNGGTTNNGGGTTTPTVPSDNGGTTNNGGGTTTPTVPSDNGGTTNNGGGTTTPTVPSDNGGITNNGGGTTTTPAPSDNGGTITSGNSNVATYVNESNLAVDSAILRRSSSQASTIVANNPIGKNSTSAAQSAATSIATAGQTNNATKEATSNSKAPKASDGKGNHSSNDNSKNTHDNSAVGHVGKFLNNIGNSIAKGFSAVGKSIGHALAAIGHTVSAVFDSIGKFFKHLF